MKTKTHKGSLFNHQQKVLTYLAASCLLFQGTIFSTSATTNELSRELVSASSWTPPAQPDPGKIMEEAKLDADAGRYAEALAKHVWYFENALKYDSGLTGVRLSFALRQWIELAAIYPPALEKLKSIRDQIEKTFLEGEAWRAPFPPFMDFSGINRALEEEAKTTKLFVWLHENHPSAAKTVFHVAQKYLIEAKEFALCGEYIGLSSFESTLDMYKRTKDRTPSGFIAEHNENNFRQKTATIVALLVLNKRQAEANQVIEKALQEVDDIEFKAMLDIARKGEFPPAKIVIPAPLPVSP